MKTSLFCYLTNPGLRRPMAESFDDMRERAVEIDEPGQCINDLHQYVRHWQGLGNMLWPGEELPPTASSIH